MITVSDTQVRSFVRSHLARLQFDVQRLELRVLNGTVSLAGELWHLGGRPASILAVQHLERDVRATTGVRFASFEFTNWHRDGQGGWQPLGAPQEVARAAAPSHAHPSPVAQAPQPERRRQTPATGRPVAVEAQLETAVAGNAAPVSAFVAPIPMTELLDVRPTRRRA